MGLIQADERGYGLFPKQGPEETPVTILATPDQIRAARIATAQLMNLAHQLRDVLKNTFTISDLV